MNLIYGNPSNPMYPQMAVTFNWPSATISGWNANSKG